MRPGSTHVTRLVPATADRVTVRAAYDVARERPADRAWIALCMIASLDGAAAVDGTSSALGNDTDRDVLLTLRDLADVIVVGAGTVHGEGYGPPSSAGQRIGVLTNTGAVDTGTALFRSGAGFLIAPRATTVVGDVEVLRAGDERVDLGEVAMLLGRRYPFVLAEGGPRLNAGLLAADLIDELDLTLAARMVGGDATRVVHEAAPASAAFELAHLLVDDEGYLFGRWVRRR